MRRVLGIRRRGGKGGGGLKSIRWWILLRGIGMGQWLSLGRGIVCEKQDLMGIKGVVDITLLTTDPDNGIDSCLGFGGFIVNFNDEIASWRGRNGFEVSESEKKA